MCKYDDKTLELIPPILGLGEKEHVLIAQDECTVSTNDHPRQMWLKDNQQPLKKMEMVAAFTFLTGSVKQQAGSHSQKSRLHSICNCLLKLDSKQQMLTKSYILGKTMMHGGIWPN